MMIIDDLLFGIFLGATVDSGPWSHLFHPFPACCGEPKCRRTCKCRESGHSSTITPWYASGDDWRWLEVVWKNFPTWKSNLVSNLVSNLLRLLRCCCLDSCGVLANFILFNHVKSRMPSLANVVQRRQPCLIVVSHSILPSGKLT